MCQTFNDPHEAKRIRDHHMYKIIGGYISNCLVGSRFVIPAFTKRISNILPGKRLSSALI